MGSPLLHASFPITHAFFQFVVFSFLFSLLFPCFVMMIPFFLMILYCLQLPPFILSTVKGFAPFTPQLLLASSRCPSKTAHWPVGYLATPIALNVLVAPLLIHRQNGCLVSYHPLFSLLSLGSGLSLSLTYLYGMHQVVPAHSYFFWVRCHPSRTFLPKKFEREPHPLFLLTARPYPLIPLTRDSPPMYWLSTSRWCLGPCVCSTSV